MDNSVVLAIGIPTINRADLLDEALQVYKDTFYGRHQLIIDNGNQPIQTYSGDQKVLKMPQNLGVSGSWNLIMKTLKNKGYTHVAILNDDIVWKKTADQVEEFIQSNPADFYQGTGTWCCFVLPVNTFDEVGGFDDGFAICYFEDNDFNIRIARKNKKVLVNPIFNPELYRNSSTIAKTPSLNTYFDKNRQRYIDKWGGLPTQEKYELPWNGGEGYDIPWK
jgi:GT2 family glycosyltransferase